ncbi:hypothetical protein, partial [Acinetobacter sp. 72431]
LSIKLRLTQIIGFKYTVEAVYAFFSLNLYSPSIKKLECSKRKLEYFGDHLILPIRTKRVSTSDPWKILPRLPEKPLFRL